MNLIDRIEAGELKKEAPQVSMMNVAGRYDEATIVRGKLTSSSRRVT